MPCPCLQGSPVQEFCVDLSANGYHAEFFPNELKSQRYMCACDDGDECNTGDKECHCPQEAENGGELYPLGGGTGGDKNEAAVLRMKGAQIGFLLALANFI